MSRTKSTEVETVIPEHISKVSEDTDKATAQLNKLMEDNGIDMMPGYTNPNEYTIEINSPQVAQFAHLIRKLDTLMGIVDTLWLNTVLTSKQRTDATYQWQQRLIKLAGRIIGIEKRARISAHSKGKEGEVAEAAPESATGDKGNRRRSRENKSSITQPKPLPLARGAFFVFYGCIFDAVILSK